MAGWTIHVCPKCHTLGSQASSCPNGCMKPSMLVKREEGEDIQVRTPIRCVPVDVVPSETGTVALINAAAKV